MGKAPMQDEDEESSNNEDGKPTPRLVSPLTERLQLDADVAAGPLSSTITDNPRQCVAAELNKISLGTDGVIAATRECSMAEEGQQWSLSTPSTNLDKRHNHTRKEKTSGKRADSPMPAPQVRPKRVGPPGASLAEQLMYLGFDDRQCEEASHRCLSIEAAMEYLASERVT